MTPSCLTRDANPSSESLNLGFEFLNASLSAKLIVEAPLVKIFRSIERAAVECLMVRFMLPQHLTFLSSVFLMNDNRVFEPLRTQAIYFSSTSNGNDSMFVDAGALSHTLSFFVSQNLPSNSASSVTIDFDDNMTSAEQRYLHARSNGILGAVMGIRVNVYYTWPLSEIITSPQLQQYNDILRILMQITSARWAADGVWKLAMDPSTACVLMTKSRNSSLCVSYRHCLVGLKWFLYLLAGLLRYYLHNIHEKIWPRFMGKISMCHSIGQLSLCHESLLRELIAICDTFQKQMVTLVHLGHRATCAFHRALNLFQSPHIVGMDEVALGIATANQVPLIDSFLSRAESAFAALRVSAANFAAALDTTYSSKAAIGNSFTDPSLEELQCIFTDLTNWT